MKARIRDKRGLTLLELLIAMAALALLAAGTITVLSTGLNTYTKNFESTVGQQGLRTAMVQITKLVRNPDNTVEATSGKGLKINGELFTVSSGRLLHNGIAYADNIASIQAAYTDASHTMIQVDLKSADDGTLSTKIALD